LIPVRDAFPVLSVVLPIIALTTRRPLLCVIAAVDIVINVGVPIDIDIDISAVPVVISPGITPRRADRCAGHE